ncbi:MAG: Holliday junction resolvase [Nanoarchaeota archaeon]|nr:Holliday junction resolvase [Nanoarchaeota archaeon]
MSKKRGIAAERELLHLLWKQGYAVARVAGSGNIPEPSCDLLAGNGKSKYAIECKTCRKDKKYIQEAQIKDFLEFSTRFGLEPIIAVRFLRKGWFFLNPIHLDKTGKGYAISQEDAEKRGVKLI